MESRFQRIFLVRTHSTLAFLIATLLVVAQPYNAIAQDEDIYSEEDENRTVLDAITNPDLKRREIKEDKIDSENFELGVYGGVMNVEDFGSNNVFGVRAAFHISEDWFVEAVYGETEVGLTTGEIFVNFELPLEDRKLTYYNASFGINLLAGEVYIGRNYAFNTAYYIIGGVGNTEFGNDEYITYNFGAGFRIFATDWLALHVDFRNHLFTHRIFFGQEKSVQNLESHLGLSVFF